MDDWYEVRYIRTKNKVRKIITYGIDDQGYRDYHNKVVSFLQKYTKDSIFAKAYTKKSSIGKNAQAHMYNDIFIKMDVKDYFNSINHQYMAACLYREINKNTSISYRECCEVVKKCSVSDKGIPLGLVSSPALANLYLKEFDGLFYGYIKTLGLNNPIYTRYADDLVVSYKDEKISDEINKLIIETATVLLKRFHLILNKKKTRVVNIRVSNHVKITGVNVIRSEKNYRHLSVGNKLKNELYWKMLDAYDHPEKYSIQELNKLKGMLSFVLSIEKRGVDQLYSKKMIELLSERGFVDLNTLSKSLVTNKLMDTNSQ